MVKQLPTFKGYTVDVRRREFRKIISVSKTGERFQLKTSRGVIEAASMVIATGGLSIPKIGATGLGYDMARQFG